VITFKEHIKLWLDSKISVDDGMFIQDVKFLAPLPLIPFVVISMFLEPRSRLIMISLIVGLVLSIMWTIFILRVRREKKAEWVSPTRWTDQNNGY